MGKTVWELEGRRGDSQASGNRFPEEPVAIAGEGI